MPPDLGKLLGAFLPAPGWLQCPFHAPLAEQCIHKVGRSHKFAVTCTIRNMGIGKAVSANRPPPLPEKPCATRADTHRCSCDEEDLTQAGREDVNNPARFLGRSRPAYYPTLGADSAS